MLQFVITHQTFAQKNLVINSGFEDEFYGWDNNGAKLTPWDFKNGKNSCAIITNTITNWVGIDQTISIPKKTQALQFSAWLKTMNVVKGSNDWDGAIFTIEFLNKQDKKIGEGLNIARLTGDQVWTLVKKSVKIPVEATSFKVLLALGNASGTMLVDDVFAKAISVEEVEK